MQIEEYTICKFMLDALNINSISLMTNNPKKLAALTNIGVNVQSRRAIDHGVTQENKNYLKTKTEKLGHHFNVNKLK